MGAASEPARHALLVARTIHTAGGQHPELAKELEATGSARADLDVERMADVLWGLADADVYLLVTEQRGWSSAEYEAWLVDAWTRILLAPRA